MKSVLVCFISLVSLYMLATMCYVLGELVIHVGQL